MKRFLAKSFDSSWDRMFSSNFLTVTWRLCLVKEGHCRQGKGRAPPGNYWKLP